MDEKLFLLVMRVFGNKIYELQTGYTVLFNLGIANHLFSEAAFHREREKIEALPDFQKLRAVLDLLGKPMEAQLLESLLKEHEGPVQ